MCETLRRLCRPASHNPILRSYRLRSDMMWKSLELLPASTEKNGPKKHAKSHRKSRTKARVCPCFSKKNVETILCTAGPHVAMVIPSSCMTRQARPSVEQHSASRTQTRLKTGVWICAHAIVITPSSLNISVPSMVIRETRLS